MWFESSSAIVETLVVVAAVEVAGLSLKTLGAHALVAGLASTWMVVMAKAGELMGNEENVSLLPPERKLPHDSDAKVGGALFVVGAVVGVGVALALHFNQEDAINYWPTSLIVGGVLGVLVPWPLVRGLGKEYLERARHNLEQGNFKEALQDASEVERISEVYKSEAIAIKDYARQQRDLQIGAPAGATGGGGGSSEVDAEFAEFLSTYKPGSL